MWPGCGRFACRPVAILHADYHAAIHFRDGCTAMGKENAEPGIRARYDRQRLEIWLYFFNPKLVRGLLRRRMPLVIVAHKAKVIQASKSKLEQGVEL